MDGLIYLLCWLGIGVFLGVCHATTSILLFGISVAIAMFFISIAVALSLGILFYGSHQIRMAKEGV